MNAALDVPHMRLIRLLGSGSFGDVYLGTIDTPCRALSASFRSLSLFHLRQVGCPRSAARLRKARRRVMDSVDARRVVRFARRGTRF